MGFPAPDPTSGRPVRGIGRVRIGCNHDGVAHRGSTLADMSTYPRKSGVGRTPCDAAAPKGAHVSLISWASPLRTPLEPYRSPFWARIVVEIARKMRFQPPLLTADNRGRPGGTRIRTSGQRERTGHTDVACALLRPKRRGRSSIQPPTRFFLWGRLAARMGPAGLVLARIRTFSFWGGSRRSWSFARARTSCSASEGTRAARRKARRNARTNSIARVASLIIRRRNQLRM